MKKHIELVNYTCFGRGVDTPGEIVNRAQKSGAKAIGIADFNSVQSYLRLQKMSKKYPEIKILYGVIFLVEAGNSQVQYEQIFLAKDQIGISQIYKLIEVAKRGVLTENQVEYTNINHLICGMPLCPADNSITHFLEGAWEKQKFILVNENLHLHTGYEKVLEFCREKTILPCASNYLDLMLTEHLPPEMHFESDIDIDNDKFKKYVDFFGKETAERIVFDNPQEIADMIEASAVPLPVKEMGAIYLSYAQELKELCRKRIHELYGWIVPKEIEQRLHLELSYIDESKSAMEYMLAKNICDSLNQRNMLIYPREVGNAPLVAYLLNISNLNPLPAHYRCGGHYFEWGNGCDCAPDLPEKECPICTRKDSMTRFLIADGYNLPFDSKWKRKAQLAFDISAEASEFIRSTQTMSFQEKEFDLLPCGIINTIPDKIGKMAKENDTDIDAERLGKVKENFAVNPYRYIGVPMGIDVPKTAINNQTVCHFNTDDIDQLPHIELMPYNSIGLFEQLARCTYSSDIDFIDMSFGFPINDPMLLEMFRSTDSIYPARCDCETSVRGVPGFSTAEIRRRLDLCRIETFRELVGVYASIWLQDLWNNELKDIIGHGEIKLHDIPLTYQDLYFYLTANGVPAEDAYELREAMRVGRITDDSKGKDGIKSIISNHHIPQWAINLCIGTRTMPSLFLCTQRAYQGLMFAAYKKYFPREFYAFTVLNKLFAKASESKGLGQECEIIPDEELSKLIQEAISRGITF